MHNIDYIIIFGRALKDNQLTEDFKFRLDTAIILANANANAKIIITGGKKVSTTAVTEAGIGKKYLAENNVKNEILLEEHSSNTIENILNIKKWVFKDQTYALVSSKEHSPRCLALWNEIYQAKAVVVNKSNNTSQYEKMQTEKDLQSIKKMKENFNEKF